MRTPLSIQALLLLAAGCAATGNRTGDGAAGDADAPGTLGSYVYVGGASGDIFIFRLDASTGQLAARGHFPAGRMASALAADPGGQYLFATSEGTGEVVSMAIGGKTGALSLQGRARSGSQPSHLWVDGTGNYVLCANTGSDNVAVFSVGHGGTLAPAETYPVGKRPAAIAVHPGNKAAFAANVKSDSLSQFSFNTGTGTLTPKSTPPVTLPTGAAPRHIDFHPGGRYTYVLDETDDLLFAYAYQADTGTLSPLAFQTISTLPPGAKGAGNRGGEVHVSPSGKHLYVSNRGHDSLAVFGVDAATGFVTLIAHTATAGGNPRAFTLDRTGQWLFVANQGSGNLVTFRVDTTTGVLSRQHSTSLASPPVSVLAVTALRR